jgi:hypothetical protein
MLVHALDSNHGFSSLREKHHCRPPRQTSQAHRHRVIKVFDATVVGGRKKRIPALSAGMVYPLYTFNKYNFQLPSQHRRDMRRQFRQTIPNFDQLLQEARFFNHEFRL